MSERPLYRLVAGHQTGPYPPAKLRPLVKDGRISSLDRFSYDGDSWAPAQSFPELLREPPAPVVAPEPCAADPEEFIEPEDDFVLPVEAVEEDESTQRLMKVVYWVIGVGGGLVALLVLLTIFTAAAGVSGGK